MTSQSGLAPAGTAVVRHRCSVGYAVVGGGAASGPLQTLVHFQCSTLGCAPNGVFFQAQDGYFRWRDRDGDFAPGEDGTVFRRSTEPVLNPGTGAVRLFRVEVDSE